MLTVIGHISQKWRDGHAEMAKNSGHPRRPKSLVCSKDTLGHLQSKDLIRPWKSEENEKNL